MSRDVVRVVAGIGRFGVLASCRTLRPLSVICLLCVAPTRALSSSLPRRRVGINRRRLFVPQHDHLKTLRDGPPVLWFSSACGLFLLFLLAGALPTPRLAGASVGCSPRADCPRRRRRRGRSRLQSARCGPAGEAKTATAPARGLGSESRRSRHRRALSGRRRERRRRRRRRGRAREEELDKRSRLGAGAVLDAVRREAAAQLVGLRACACSERASGARGSGDTWTL